MMFAGKQVEMDDMDEEASGSEDDEASGSEDETTDFLASCDSDDARLATTLTDLLIDWLIKLILIMFYIQLHFLS